MRSMRQRAVWEMARKSGIDTNGTPVSKIDTSTISVKNLARRIKQSSAYKPENGFTAAVYEDELQRIWPLTEKDRQAKIARLARNLGLS